jgi:hypothetical protein
MHRDAQTNMWEAAVLTATGVSTNTYDQGAIPTGGTASGAQPTIGDGKPMVLVLAVGSAAKVSATNETYEFDIIQSANANLSSADVLAQYAFTNAQAAAILLAGAVIILPIPQIAITKRYLGAQVVEGGTSPTITVTAWFAPADMTEDAGKYYSSLITVL